MHFQLGLASKRRVEKPPLYVRLSQYLHRIGARQFSTNNSIEYSVTFLSVSERRTPQHKGGDIHCGVYLSVEMIRTKDATRHQ